MGKVTIENLVDWGKSFVDKDGNFFAGTLEEQKDIAVSVARTADMWVYSGDVHPRSSTEFLVNDGLYPTHNLVKRDWYDLDELGVAEGRTVSPQLTEKLLDLVKDKKSGLIAPRHLFFQDFDGGRPEPCFSVADLEETFGVKRLTDYGALLDGEVEYVVNAKHMFNAAGLQGTEWMGHFEGIPDIDDNAYTILKRKYGLGRNLRLNFTGVVMGICIYQSAVGTKQVFPKAEVNIIADASTHLIYEKLGFADSETADFAVRKMCKQVGVNYIKSHEYLGRRD